MKKSCIECQKEFKCCQTQEHNFCSKACYIKNKKNQNKKIIFGLSKNLPRNIPITYRILIEYYKKGLCFEPSRIFSYFGNIENFCKECGLLCGARTKHYLSKEEIIKLLQEGNKEFGSNLSPTNLILAINKKNNIDIRGACKKLFGNYIIACKEAGVQNKKHYWTNEELILKLQELYKEKNGKLNKCDINKSRKLCRSKLIRDRFGSFDKAAEYANIQFIPFSDFKGTHFTGRKGLKEDFILDKVEEQNGIKLIRQYRVGRKFVDGFHPETNTVYEVDENGHFHPYQQIKDYFRQQQIEKQIGCNFVRIKQDEFLSQLENKAINQFGGI